MILSSCQKLVPYFSHCIMSPGGESSQAVGASHHQRVPITFISSISEIILSDKHHIIYCVSGSCAGHYTDHRKPLGDTSLEHKAV